jgi:uncharacterized protein (DUF58 family)
VRTWRPERDRHLLLVLDSSRTSAGRVGDVPRLDAALDAALLLAALASRAGDRVDLLAFDRQVRAAVEGAGRTEVLPRMVDAMAGLEPALVEGDGRGLVGEVLRRARRRSLVVLFTSLDTAPLEAGLLPLLPSLTSRHTVLLAAVADPRVEQMARGGGTVDAVYDAAAAERARTERRRLTSTLRQRGVEVVDAPPETFAPAVSDAYLSLKAAVDQRPPERLLRSGRVDAHRGEGAADSRQVLGDVTAVHLEDHGDARCLASDQDGVGCANQPASRIRAAARHLGPDGASHPGRPGPAR